MNPKDELPLWLLTDICILSPYINVGFLKLYVVLETKGC